VKNVVRSGKNYAVIKRIHPNVLSVERQIASIENCPKVPGTTLKLVDFLERLKPKGIDKT
jgi:hypothetical protein